MGPRWGSSPAHGELGRSGGPEQGPGWVQTQQVEVLPEITSCKEDRECGEDVGLP